MRSGPKGEVCLFSDSPRSRAHTLTLTSQQSQRPQEVVQAPGLPSKGPSSHSAQTWGNEEPTRQGITTEDQARGRWATVSFLLLQLLSQGHGRPVQNIWAGGFPWHRTTQCQEANAHKALSTHFKLGHHPISSFTRCAARFFFLYHLFHLLER